MTTYIEDDRTMKPDRLLPMSIVLWAGVTGALTVATPAPWAVRLDVASVRLSISGGGTAVRNRTPLFGIGQLAGWRR